MPRRDPRDERSARGTINIGRVRPNEDAKSFSGNLNKSWKQHRSKASKADDTVSSAADSKLDDDSDEDTTNRISGALAQDCVATVNENFQRLLDCVGRPDDDRATDDAVEFVQERARSMLNHFGAYISHDRASWCWLAEDAADQEDAYKWLRVPMWQWKPPMRLTPLQVADLCQPLKTALSELESAVLAYGRRASDLVSEPGAGMSAPVLTTRNQARNSTRKITRACTAGTAASAGGMSLTSPDTSPPAVQCRETRGTATSFAVPSQFTQELNIMRDNLEIACDEFMLKLIKQVHFPFTYKLRKHDGRAIHMASLYWEADECRHMINELINLKANPEQACLTTSFGNQATVFPIHLAAGSGNLTALETLFEAGADVDLKVRTTDEKKKGDEAGGDKASGPGSFVPSVVKKPLEAGRRIYRGGGSSRRCTTGRAPVLTARESEHYTALHEAAFFKEVSSTRALIEAQADVNATNKFSQTALHTAAKFGASDVAQLLVESGACLDTKDPNGGNALDLALDNGNFPIRKLHILSRCSIDDVLKVARKSPAAAAELMRDQARDSISNEARVHPAWRKALPVESSTRVDIDICECWRELMRIAPQAGEDYLEALTIVPEVQDKNHHPLPRQAMLRPTEITRSCYVMGAEQFGGRPAWTFSGTAGNNPEPRWHQDVNKGLAPQLRRSLTSTSGQGTALESLIRIGEFVWQGFLNRLNGRKMTTRVRVKAVQIRNFVCPEVLYVLANTSHQHIFSKVATRAVIQVVWTERVLHFYNSEVCYRCIEIFVLLVWVFWPRAERDEFAERAMWNFLFASNGRELLYEFFEVRGLFRLMAEGEMGTSHQYFKFVSNYVTVGNVVDLTTILALMMLCVLHIWGEDSDKQYTALLAFVCVSRWITLLIALRAFEAVGKKLLPIFKSTSAMGGIFCVTLFVFLGFLHAFWALSDPGVAKRQIFIDAVRFLFVGDGDGIDMVLDLGRQSDSSAPEFLSVAFLIVALFMFCIWIMNLFIAGTDQAYEQALEYAHTAFLQERAAICLQCLFRPSLAWMFHFRVSVFIGRLLQFFVLLPLWTALCWARVMPDWVSALLLCVLMVVSEAVMCELPGERTMRREGKALASPAGRRVTTEVADATRMPQLPPGVSPSAANMSAAPQPAVLAQRSLENILEARPSEEEMPLPPARWTASFVAEPEAGLIGVPAHPATPVAEAQPQPPREATPVCEARPQPPREAPPQILALPIETDLLPERGMYLWICHREDYEEMDYWPSEGLTATAMEGRVAGLKRDNMLRNRRLAFELGDMKRRTEQVMDNIHKDLSIVRYETRQMEKRFDRKLDGLEALLRRSIVSPHRASRREPLDPDVDRGEDQSEGDFSRSYRPSTAPTWGSANRHMLQQVVEQHSVQEPPQPPASP